jgi:hypothetical protein
VTAYSTLTAHRSFGLALRLAALTILGTATASLAEPQALSGPTLRAAVSGSTVEIDTPIGTKVPVKYGADNSVSGEAGSVAFFLGSAADTGRWWVAQDLLCHRWNIWFKAEKTCLKITRDGNKITWLRDDGDSGTATIMPKATTLAARQLSDRKSTLGGPVDTMPAPARVAAPAPLHQPVEDAAEELPAYVPAAADAAPVEPVPVQAAPIAAKAPALIRAGMTPQIKKKPVAKVAALQPAAMPAAKQKVAKRSVARGATDAPTFWVYGVAENDVLNVRMGPSPEHDVVGAIPPQARGVRMAGACEGMWCLVQFGDQKGWVNRSYLVYEVPELVAAR